MYYSITFGDKNTYDDWGLLPTSFPVVNPPDVKTSIVDLPLGNGSVDLTEQNGGPFYGLRKGSWEFVFSEDHLPWEKVYPEIVNALHGLRKKVVMGYDPEHCYIGRLAVSNPKVGANSCTITIDYQLDPTMYGVDMSVEETGGSSESYMASYIDGDGHLNFQRTNFTGCDLYLDSNGHLILEIPDE